MPGENNARVDHLAALSKLMPRLPSVAQQDTYIRVGDWLRGGGTPFDGYIAQQVRFAERLLDQTPPGDN